MNLTLLNLFDVWTLMFLALRKQIIADIDELRGGSLRLTYL